MIAPPTVPAFWLFALALVVVLLWFTLLTLGRRVDPLRRFGYVKDGVASKVEDNERIAVENRIRRHPEYAGLDGDGRPLVSHLEVDRFPGGDCVHLLDPSGCRGCVEFREVVCG